MRRFVLGLGKKVLIANTLGRAADAIFGLPADELTTPLAWLGLACYTLQIYFDFSGYSDMAIGLMRMFGFRILENFNYPYISRSIREFWRRWHISLSNWFRDYLYIPLGGNQRGERRAYANLVIVFLLCGLWHGASWPFVLWGAWHGAFLVAERAGLDRRCGAAARLRGSRRTSMRCRRHGRLGAVPLRHARPRARVLPRAGRLRAGRAVAASGRAVSRSAAWRSRWRSPAVFATPLARRIGAWRDTRGGDAGRRRRPPCSAPTSRWLALVGVLASAFLAAGTYNPFIYFRF